jgi:hypothetical protein
MSTILSERRFEATGEAYRSTRFHWAALLFCLLNLLFFTSVTPYMKQGGQRLDNADFSRGLEGWRVEGERGTFEVVDGTLKIDHRTTRTTTMVTQCLPAGALPDTLQLTTSASSRGVVRGSEPWYDAHIDLVGFNTRGEPNYHVKVRLLDLVGDRDWRRTSDIFRKPDSATQVCVRISLFVATGAFDVSHLSLYGLVDNPFYLIGTRMLLLGWIVLGLWMAEALFRNYRVKPQGRYLLLFLPLLLGGILMPQVVHLTIEHHLLPLFTHMGLHLETVKTLDEPGHWALWPMHWDLSKLSHLIGFMLLSIILFSDKRVGIAWGFSALLLLAAATELMQFFVPERTPRLSDAIVDSTGAGLGLALTLLIGKFVWPRTARKAE